MIWPHRRSLMIEAAAFSAARGEFGRASAIAGLAVRQWPDELEAHRIIAAVALDTDNRPLAADALRAGLGLAPADPNLRQMQAALDSMTAAAGSAAGQ